ncbi:MAG: S8 family peptidase [Geminicoccaceae bacterium]
MAKDKARKATSRKRSAISDPEGGAAAAPGASSQPTEERPRAFTPDVLETTVIALPLLHQLKAANGTARVYDIIVDVNRDFPGGREQAQKRIRDLIEKLVSAHGLDPRDQGVHARKTDMTRQYVFGRLRGDLIQKLVQKDRQKAERARAEDRQKPALYRIWPDFMVSRMTHRSLATVKADAARNAFSAHGREIVWAVLDSGIDANHPHFRTHQNLELPAPLRHCDFTTFGELSEDESEQAALIDEAGHGTHVAGIIAGELREGIDQRLGQVRIKATVNRKNEHGEVVHDHPEIKAISGMAPGCKLISLKVLDQHGKGPVSNLIAACERIQEINGNGRYIRIHGVNMSVGYDFEPSWFACGQSPLCVEVDRLARSGVVVVVAAGNTGYGWNQTAFRGAVAAGMDLTINDPGNAEGAITVGSTHRDMPHVYGVSYFSSKGPTGDGRLKPDLVAPGEKIVSCQIGGNGAAEGAGSVGAAQANVIEALYKEDSGTSMAAPHVSGVIAAFLSIRREFIGRPDRVKEIFMATATDLRRERYFQGSGLVDLMRAIQSV